jgi:hypothetical protein
MLDTSKNVSMTQAIIRTTRDGLKNLNALPIITKKLQVSGGQWSDSEEDFSEFKRLNTMLIERHLSDNWNKLVFPQGFATDKAQLPTRFAEWLQKELLNNFGLVTELNETKSGLISKSIINNPKLSKLETSNVQGTQSGKVVSRKSLLESLIKKEDNLPVAKGAVVQYKDSKWILWNVNSSGKAQLIDVEGKKAPGTPNINNIKVLSYYPTTVYNGVDYIVTPNENIYSLATGDKVYTAIDNSTKTQKERIIKQLLEENGLIPSPDAKSIDELFGNLPDCIP